ncbi:MAG: hypothetical protein L0206_01635 [Actinobacteria bacterium]|nr:hypothetical protein [Actinomycetota bacterium]
MPTFRGIDRNGRPRTTFSTPKAPISTAAPPSASSRLVVQLASMSSAFTISTTKTRARNGLARVKMSSVA